MMIDKEQDVVVAAETVGVGEAVEENLLTRHSLNVFNAISWAIFSMNALGLRNKPITQRLKRQLKSRMRF